MKGFCFILFLSLLFHVNVSVERIDLRADFKLAKHQVRLICFFCISKDLIKKLIESSGLPEQWKSPTGKSWPGWTRRLLASSSISWSSTTLPHWDFGLCAPGICCTNLRTFKLRH